MKRLNSFISIYFIGMVFLMAQTPATIHIPNPINPPNSSTPSYTRATTSIFLDTTFKYGFDGAGALNLLNLHISSYPAYVNNNYQDPANTPNYYSINPALEAAVTSGVPGVDAMGGFSYNMPIVCSPGTAGIEPQLSISYNSNGSNNWLGLGFDIGGISRISRVGKSVFYDGVNGGVNFNSSDVFAIDGTRLLLKGGTYGSNNATYKTPVENYYSITSVSSQGSGPQYFTVTTPDGMTMEYGKTSDSRSIENSGAEAMAWYINKVYDAFGNYMTYSYINTNGEILIDKINYTGNSNNNLSPYNTIEFTYEDRSDAGIFYVAAREFDRKHILKSIACKDMNNAIVRKYFFDYKYAFASLLSKITETDALGNELNPTYFDWTSTGKSGQYYGCPVNTSIPNSPSTPAYTEFIAADLNGDGKKDMLLLENTQGFKAQVELSVPGVGCFFTPASPIDFSPGSLLSIRTAPVKYIGSFVFDEDDDDIEEVFIIYAIGLTYYVDKIKNTSGSFAVTNETSGSIGNPALSSWSTLVNFYGYTTVYNKSSYFYMKQDVTGDNIKDIVTTDQYGLTLSPSGASNITLSTPDIIKTALGDFDGDGTADIFIIKNNTSNASPYACEVYKYNPTNNTLNLITSSLVNIGVNPNMANWPTNNAVVNNYANASKSIDFGDFNGDGKTDLMYINYVNATDGTISVLRSSGFTFLPDNNQITVPLTLNTYEANFAAADINNDGYCDVMVSAYDYVNKADNFNYYPSNGNFLTPAAAAVQTYPNEMLGCLADFDGNGLLDYIGQVDFATDQVTFNAFNQDNKKLVNHIFNIRDNLNVTYDYLPGVSSIASGTYYNKSALINTDPAFKSVKPSVFVVTKTVNNGKMFTYGYNNAVFHRLGKGFVGFEKVYTGDRDKPLASSFYRGSISTYTYSASFDDIFASEQTETAMGNPNIFSVSASYVSAYNSTTFNYTSSGSNRFLNSVSSTAKDYLSSTYQTQSSAFDNNAGGQVLNSMVTNLTWAGLPINSVQNSYLYQSLINPFNNSIYYRGKKITQVRTANSVSSTYVTDLNYNTQYGYLTSTVKNSNLSSLAVTTTYSQFNAFGKALSTSVTAPDLAQPRTSSVQYDATGRFIVQSVDALGDASQVLYDPAYGNIIQSTGVNGLVSAFKYDGLGRLIKTTSPTGAVNASKYEWYSYGSGTPQPYGLKVTNTYEGNGSEIVYLDNHGNQLKSESTGFNGSTIVAQNVYDVNDLLLTSEPAHFTGQAVYKTNLYVYDDYQRVKTVLENNNSGVVLNTVSYNYNNPSTNSTYIKGSYTVQTTSGNGTGTLYNARQNNEAGQVDLVSNYNNASSQNKATYTFNQHGQPAQIVTSFPGGQGGSTTNFTYDLLGRRQTMTDPSSGTSVFDINSIGELKQVTSPIGQYTYTYDQLGRLLTKTGSSQGVYNYEYVTSGNGLLGLKKVTGPSVITEYQYDGFNRPIEKKESFGTGAGSKQFKSNYTYDKYGRLVDYTYPSNFKTTNTYDANGILTAIKNNNTSIWALTSMTAPDLVKNYSNSANMATQMVYDNSLNLQQVKLGSIHTQNYTTNASTANMLNRGQQNFVSNVSNNEGFEYDDLNRLVRNTWVDASNNTLTKQNYSYKANGNLDHKDDCGDYIYGNTAAPYQLTQLQNATGNTSLNSLNITNNDFDKVSQVVEAVSGKEFDFVYGNDAQRFKMDYLVNSQLQYSRYYQDNYDRQENASGSYKEWSYIYAPTGLAAVYYNNNGTTQLLNVTTDQLGSPLMLTSQAGQVLEEYSFDAWGRRRNPIDWSYTNMPALQYMIRGYTGHEQLDELGLVNMNGRMYDPVLGRFIQPDPLIQSPGDMQNMNRYSYVLNNPLKYTDPSGYQRVAPRTGVAPDPVVGGRFNGAKPVVFVDGIRIESGSGGYDFFLGGGGGGNATTQYFGVWDGNGPGIKDAYVSRGAVLDYANSGGKISGMNGSGAYVALNPVAFGNKNTLFANPITGKLSAERLPTTLEEAGNTPGAIVEWTEFCDNCLNQSTVGNNLGGLTYAGSNNALSMDRQQNFSYIPTNAADYPPIGHDRRYLKLGTSGLKGVLTDTRAIGADWKFISEEIGIGANPFLSFSDRFAANSLAALMTLGTITKTLYQMNDPMGITESVLWYQASSQGVNNNPTPHHH